MANKKWRISTPNWSELHFPLLELVLKKLSFLDILKFRAVCRSWNKAAKSYVFSPLLMIPGNQTESNNDHDIDNNTVWRQVFSLAEKKVYSFENSCKELGDDFWCVGSSHGWLVLLGRGLNFLVFNPFSRGKIVLPSITSLPGMNRTSPEICISKAILISPGSSKLGKKMKSAIVIYGYIAHKLAYCNVGDKSWTELNGKNSPYSDILCCNDWLYALSYSNSVEVWDFKSNSFPIKVASFVPCEVSVPSLTIGNYSTDKYFCKKYLVESKGEILLVTRFIGYYVNVDGELLDDGDLLTDENTHPLICPYRTVEFCVHKMDLRGRRWVKVERLDDRAFFLGGNESLSFFTRDLAACKGNSIYFTDDNWEDMTSDYLYGGHDLGVYDLEKKVVEACYEFDDEKVFPPPIWIVPS
ncbi:hypothetical protein TIFTF001_030553 [Ficus carica]|uniref:F-box domain-containing protein n=1 Tax=Ficus carica TaxID=3494 RepID=A0AA88DTR8_FICCA|nr:hypothetical protein TIFTF001_030553 [Ficus carica]